MKKITLISAAVFGSLLIGCTSPVETGTDMLKEQKYEQAVKSFDEAIEKWEDKEKKVEQVSEAYRGKGVAYWELEDYANAKAAFLTALEKGTQKTGTIYNFIGICDLKQGNYAEAVNDFEQGIACEGNSAELMQEMEFNQISAYEQLRDWENAKAKMTAYIAKYPDDANAAKEAQFLETR